MHKTFNHFSFNDLFWIQINEHFISFGFKGLPIDIHFTIAFNLRSKDINLHLTKNTVDPKNKPKITIVTIDKTVLYQDIDFLVSKLLNKVLILIDIKEYINNHDNNLGFISFENLLDSDSFSVIEQELTDRFKYSLKIKKKTRLKVEGDIESKLETFAKSDTIQSAMIESTFELTDEFTSLLDSGLLVSESNTVQVIRLKNKWFTLKTDFKAIDIVTILTNSEIAKVLSYKTKRGLVILKNSSTFEDTRQHNKPIRLVRQQP